MSAPTSVLLFAAGLGTRMAPLTHDRPKPMVRVAGKPLLDHARSLCTGLRTVVNVHYFADQIIDHLADTNTKISDETDLLRDTGGGLKHALPLLGDGPVFTMNTDAVWRGPNPIGTLRAAWDPDQMDALLMMIRLDPTTTHPGGASFDLDAEGRMSKGTAAAYTGLQIIKTDRLQDISADVFSMWELWTDMLAAGRMFGTYYPGKWCDVGRPDSIKVAEDMLGGHDV